MTVALGMTGKRFDHTLAALDAVTRYAVRRKIILVDEEDVAVALTTSFSFEVAPGRRVSIHPLAPVTFWTSEGLKYPRFDAMKLAPGVRTGTERGAGRAVQDRAGGGIHAPYLLILPRQYLAPLIGKLLLEKR